MRFPTGNSDDREIAVYDVEPDQICQAKPLHLKHKGVTYYAGSVTPKGASLPNPTDEETDEQLDTVKDDLGCNAIIVSGGHATEDRMIECGRMATDRRFERVYLLPHYVNASVDETVTKGENLQRRLRP